MQFFVIFLILCVTTATAFKIIPTLALRKSTTLSSIQEDIEISSIQQIEKNGLNIALKSITAAATTLLGTAVTRSKLGSFISAFTDFYESENNGNTQKALEMAQDTVNWGSHFVKFISWRAKNREIKVVS